MAVDEVYEAYAAARPKSLEYLARACKVLGGKAGHDLRYSTPVPLYIDRGEAGRKWDVDGNEYIDFLLGNGALLLGHAPAEVVEAINETVGKGTHFGNDHRLHIEWAELVQQLVPSAERVRFVNSGTEATLLALRLARAFTGRKKTLRFAGHFHGWHDDVVHGFQSPFDQQGSLGVPSHDHMVCIPAGDLNLVEEKLKTAGDFAAVIVEPSGASWGRVPLDPEFLRGLEQLTRQREELLIFDEVVTGFRYSPGGAQGLYGLNPDLSCFAKVVAGGMPGGAVVGRADVMELFDVTGDPQHDRFGRVVHQGTFNGAPLCAAAGVAVLKQVATGEPIARANALAAKLRAAWDQVLEEMGVAGYLYGVCSTFHVYFETDRNRVQAATSRAELYTNDADRLKGMPGALVESYQRQLRFHGVDNMSSTGGLLSAAHTDRDIEEATVAFRLTVEGLLASGQVLSL